MTASLEKVLLDDESSNAKNNRMYYKQLGRYYLADEARKENKEAVLTAAAYHKDTKILVTGECCFYSRYSVDQAHRFHKLG